MSVERLSQLRNSNVQMLIVTGTDDNFVEPSGSYYLHEHLGCELAVFKGSGHIIPSEQTFAYCKLVERMFQRGIMKEF